MAIVPPSECGVSNESVEQQVHCDHNRKRIGVDVPASESGPHDETWQAQKSQRHLDSFIEWGRRPQNREGLKQKGKQSESAADDKRYNASLHADLFSRHNPIM